MRRTGFTKAQVETLRTRDGNVCVWTGATTDRLVPQHRRNRGMGGNRDLNTLENGVLLDSIVNGLIESDAGLGEMAKAYGIKVGRTTVPISSIPVFYRHEHGWFTFEGVSRHEISASYAAHLMQGAYGDEWFAWKARADENVHDTIMTLRGGK
ncbi:hypothetical protein [Microbacterium testaceum]|uniref:hypothetical protein n=1 Tax=Microbacterium testaceum TaxID=2033 RepID=UPI000733F2EA|nr:hypothetical protein [Microbacterium testaceum]